ncbi:MAG: hypothetical protein KC933_33755 [Myxococcales bacterium]|nr:hypothetical protein [Myxococcales bacterium]MCB9650544.1 hypothetical protein [Deltaproteobacteria bacterium]
MSGEDDAPAPGPVQAGLEALWGAHRSRWRRLLSPRMVQELTLRASFDVDLIAPHRVANAIPKGTIPDCEACPNVCCAGLENVVSLRLKDVAQLIDLDRTDLMSRHKPNFPRWMLAERPYLAELVASTLWRALPVMRQVGDLNVCAALGRDMKCTLHPHWPTSCERFPYSLVAARRQVVWGTRCPVKKRDPVYEARSEALFQAAISAYNERVRDAVLLAHARRALDDLGLGAWITGPDEDPFEPRSSALDIID